MKDFNDIKDHIIKTYLKNNELHEIKKEAIRNICKFYSEAKNIELNNLINSFEKDLTRIIAFEDIKILGDFNYFLSISNNHGTLSYCRFFILWNDLQLFADSKIDEKHYHEEIDALRQKITAIQKFSSDIIKLDKLPNHPADIIRDYFTFENELNTDERKILLDIVNSICISLNIRFKGAYKTIPHASKIGKRRDDAWFEILKFDEILKQNACIMSPFIQIDEDTYESHIIETKPPTYTADEYKKYMINKKKYENNYLSQYRAAEKIIKIKKKR